MGLLSSEVLISEAMVDENLLRLLFAHCTDKNQMIALNMVGYLRSKGPMTSNQGDNFGGRSPAAPGRPAVFGHVYEIRRLKDHRDDGQIVETKICPSTL